MQPCTQYSSPTGNRTKKVSWNRIGSSSHQVLWEPRPDPRWTTGSVTVQVKIQDLKQGSWNRGQVLQISAQNWLTWATHKPIMTVLGWEFHYTHCCLVLHANLSCKFLCMVCFPGWSTNTSVLCSTYLSIITATQPAARNWMYSGMVLALMDQSPNF